jgi:hypothetical protein
MPAVILLILGPPDFLIAGLDACSDFLVAGIMAS